MSSPFFIAMLDGTYSLLSVVLNTTVLRTTLMHEFLFFYRHAGWNLLSAITVLRTTLVREFPFFYSHAGWNLLSAITVLRTILVHEFLFFIAMLDGTYSLR